MAIHQIRIPEIHTFTEGVVAKGISIKKAKTQALYEAGVFDGVYALTNTGMTGSDGAILSNLPSSYITSFEGLWNTFLKPSDYAVVEYDGTGNIITPLGRVKAFSQHLRYVEFTQAVATILVNNITSDDIINAVEAGSNVSVTGLVGGDATTNDLITFVVNGTSYSGLVALDNTFSISVPGPDLVADLSFDVTINNAIGTSKVYTATTTSTHTVDLTATATITIDDILIAEITTAMSASSNVTVTGSVTGDAAVGDTVSTTVDGNFYTGTVAAGDVYSVAIPGSALATQTSLTMSVAGFDDVGNAFTVSVTKDYLVEEPSAPTGGWTEIEPVPEGDYPINIIPRKVTLDNIINKIEVLDDVYISAELTGYTGFQSRTASVTVNGVIHETVVNTSNIFGFLVPGSDLALGETPAASPDLDVVNSYTLTVVGVLPTGQTITKSVVVNYEVKFRDPVPPTLIIDNIATDNIIDEVEVEGTLDITGSYIFNEPGEVLDSLLATARLDNQSVYLPAISKTIDQVNQTFKITVDAATLCRANVSEVNISLITDTYIGYGGTSYGGTTETKIYQAVKVTATLVPIDFTTPHIFRITAPCQIDWGNGVYVDHPTHTDTNNVASGDIKMRTFGTAQIIKFESDTFSHISIKNYDSLNNLILLLKG